MTGSLKRAYMALRLAKPQLPHGHLAPFCMKRRESWVGKDCSRACHFPPPALQRALSGPGLLVQTLTVPTVASALWEEKKRKGALNSAERGIWGSDSVPHILIWA